MTAKQLESSACYLNYFSHPTAWGCYGIFRDYPHFALYEFICFLLCFSIEIEQLHVSKRYRKLLSISKSHPQAVGCPFSINRHRLIYWTPHSHAPVRQWTRKMQDPSSQAVRQSGSTYVMQLT